MGWFSPRGLAWIVLGKEAALFLPSGRMCNETAVLVHCRPGDKVYAEHRAHLIHFEAA